MYRPEFEKYIVAILLTVATIFVIASYDRYLPIAELDEGILLSQTIRDRGIETFDVYTVDGYPPLILMLFTSVQLVTEVILQETVLNHAGLVVRLVRVLSIGANLTTVLFMYLIGKKLQNPLVGAISGLMWATLPLIHFQSVHALTEPWQIVFITATAWVMLQALAKPNIKWVILCTILGLFAILAKYNAFPALGFGVGTTFWFLLTHDHKKWWIGVFVAQVTLIGIVGYFLFFVYGAQELFTAGRPEAAQFVNGGLMTLFKPDTVVYIFSVVATLLGFPHISVLLLIVFTGFALYLLKARPPQRLALTYMAIVAVSFIWMVPSYLVHAVLRFRYVSSVSSLMVILITISLWQISRVVAQRTKQITASPFLFLIIIGVWFIPAAWFRLNEVIALQTPHPGILATEWSNSSLEPGAGLAITGLEGGDMRWRYFNNLWGDYAGPSRPLFNILLYLQEPRSAWSDAGIDYVHLTGNYPGDYPELPFAREDMLLLNAFEAQNSGLNWYNDSWYNSSWYIYRLERYEYTSNYQFGNLINMVGYDLSEQTIHSGDTIELQFFWQSLQSPPSDYHLFIHLSDLDVHNVLGQIDGSPGLATRMTSSWNDTDEILISPHYQLAIPFDLPKGEYRILLGLYDPVTGQRLSTGDGQDTIELSRITVE